MMGLARRLRARLSRASSSSSTLEKSEDAAEQTAHQQKAQGSIAAPGDDAGAGAALNDAEVDGESRPGTGGTGENQGLATISRSDASGNVAATRSTPAANNVTIFVHPDGAHPPRRASAASANLAAIHESMPQASTSTAHQQPSVEHDAGGPFDLAAHIEGPTAASNLDPPAQAAPQNNAPTTASIDFVDPFRTADVVSSAQTLPLRSAVGSLKSQAAALNSSNSAIGVFRRQSLLPKNQTALIRSLLANSAGNSHLPTADDASTASFDPHQIMPNMVTRKIWVKRPSGSPTMVTVTEEDLVDDVRDLILRKFGNSLGRTFDSPDINIRIVPRDGPRESRVMKPEEPMARTIDAYYPGGQGVDDALLVDVPRRTTPRASPRAGPPHAQAVYFVDDAGRPAENAIDYFGPNAVVPAQVPGHGALNVQPSAMAMVQSGQIPQIPSPGGARRHYTSRPERPRLGRQHTSSPTILSVAVGGAQGAPGAVPGAMVGGHNFSASTSSNHNHSHAPPPPAPHHHHSSSAASVSAQLPRSRAHSTSPEHSPNVQHGHQMGSSGAGQVQHHLSDTGTVVPAVSSSGATQEHSPSTSQQVGTPPPARVSSPRPSSAALIGPAVTTGASNIAGAGAGGPNVAGGGGTVAPRGGAKRGRKGNPEHTPLISLAKPIKIPPISVLIVEDNIINLRLLEAFMKRLGVRWQTAMNGADAVKKWMGGGFHLVLMDIQLPIMSGLEATREIRMLERANNIGAFNLQPAGLDKARGAGVPGLSVGQDGTPVKLENRDKFKSPVIIVALTASSLQSDRHEALAAGCNDFLTKPVTYVWLERKVMEWGCMQALIDYENFHKWKRPTPAPAADKAKSKGKKLGRAGAPTSLPPAEAEAAAS